MTEEQRVNFEKCDKWHTCSASVCPLYHRVECTYYIPGDKRCTKLLDHLEGAELPEDLRAEIIATQPRWRKALSDTLLNKWLKNRRDARNHFNKTVK
ncbi:MAG TPA: hypothetical protein DDZ40_12520 [Deltaproteobacteria bacterium]|nr:hypothetical protein [Deltaproteobacteria bacterium]